VKVVVTGATGNVGTSTVQALSAAPEIDEIVGLNLSAFFGAQPDSTTKLAGFVAFEHLEVAAYKLLQRVAARAGDEGVGGHGGGGPHRGAPRGRAGS
jgi:nucleoside-diphosphate-sugar epimerase